ncbi:MAG: hypothetical protein V4850_01130 [Myxococcota bacterium]
MVRLLLAFVLLNGCQEHIGTLCTKMGCEGVLTITLDGELPDGAEVTVLLDGEPCVVAENGDCQLAEDGSAITVLLSFGAGEPEVVVRIAVDDTSDNYVLAPDWDEPVYPNGEECDGAEGGCVGGEAVLVL